MRGQKIAGFGMATVAAFGAIMAYADPLLSDNPGTFGLPGLIDMPSAESIPEGTIGATVFRFGGGLRITATFQVTDRLQGAFRYSRVPGIFTNGTALYDRSFDVQYRLLDEKGMRPAVAIGLRDFIGTGVYSGEYIVATKTITPRLRATAGLGWGRLGTNGDIGSPFGSRPTLDIGQGGKANTDQWFRGPAAPFFGFAWDANDKLTLKAEYSSDAYPRETAAGTLSRDSSVNFGFDYRINKSASLSGYYLYGSEVGLQFNLSLDPRNPPAPSGLETAPLPVRPRPSPSSDPAAWATDWTADPEVHPGVQTAVAKAMEKDGMVLESMALSATRAEVRLRNQKYLAQPQAIGRTARILTRALPPSVETLVITSVAEGMPTSSVTLARRDVEQLESEESVALLRKAEFSDAVAGAHPGLVQTEGAYPRFVWSLSPYGEASVFDPDDPLRADFGVELAGRYEFAPGLILSGSVRKKIIGNLDESTRVSDSTVYHVRSDLVEYQKQGDPGIHDLTLAWYSRPAPNLYGRVTVGLLERMYGGVSGELLWKPVDSRLALGAEVNYVKQRDFDTLFSFRDYEIATGHVSAYYDFGKGFMGQVDVGRYLLGDWGATFTLDREFANGWKVGAYATFTDLSEADFGEGSFDKGVRLTIPVSWTTGTPSINKVSTVIKPLNRDGGARLDVDGRLYDTIRNTHQGDMQIQWGRFWR
ncbi:YjbH domain-containing protein [Defluviimonas sp. SAOS-178_SWC]|uniref:YjbH domain-containing protein n=1 Tax=Defluviimonas sp. SAOS-178_SWC TaxID=3121287 RepID=UPI0032221B95